MAPNSEHSSNEPNFELSAPVHVSGELGRLAQAVEAGRQQGKLALYFGCWNQLGHYLHGPGGMGEREALQRAPRLPWSMAHMDGGLLKNGKHRDTYDGKVFWTCGGRTFWYAFFWWDRSKDTRGASNSGFYVRGFGWPEPQEAFDYACSVFPNVVGRQHHPLVLQGVTT
jgi:hypothetical protein